MDKYSLIAISVVLIMTLFLTFSPSQAVETDPDYIGMVSEINESSSGYTFTFSTESETMKCYYQDRPDESLYKIDGSFSDDGNIFFVSAMTEVQ